MLPTQTRPQTSASASAKCVRHVESVKHHSILQHTAPLLVDGEGEEDDEEDEDEEYDD